MSKNNKNKIWKPTIKNWMGKLGFNFDGVFITDPFVSPLLVIREC